MAALLAAAFGLAGCRGSAAPAPVVVAFGDRPATLDPHLHNNNITWSVLSSFYDGLVAFSPEMKLEPALATSWTQTDLKTWRFALREGVQFDDGEQFTAADVVASVDRVRTHPRSALAFHFAAVAEVIADGDFTVRVVTDRPVPDLLNRLTFLTIVSHRDAPLGEIGRPNGTGPYRFAGRDNEGSVLLEARQSWRGMPPIAHARFAFFSGPEAATRALLTGSADVAHLVPDDLLAAARQTPNVRLLVQPRLGVQMLAFYPANADGPARRALGDLRVRRALLLALDRPGWVERLFHGNATVATQLVHPAVLGYDPQIRALPFDPVQARALLESAGYSEGFDVTLGHGAGSTMLTNAIASDLAAIKVRVKSVEAPAADMTKLVRERKIALQVFSWACATGDASDIFDQFVLPPASMGIRSLRYWGFSSPSVDRRLAEAARSADSLKRLTTLQAAERDLLDMLPLLPLTVRWSYVGVSDRIDLVPRFDERHWIAAYRWRR